MLGFHTEYSCTGDFKRSMKASVCFAQVFGALGNAKNPSINYIIRIYPGLKVAKTKSWSNACLLTRQELKNHINQLKGIISFKAKIVNKKGENGDFFEVHLKLDKAPVIHHKLILTWVRYVYEFPYNVYLVEALKLRKEKLFMFDSVANLFNLVGSCMGLSGGHTIGYGQEIGFLQRRELKARINEQHSLNSIYKNSYNGETISTSINYKNKKLTYYDLEFWTNEELFQDRLSVYVEKYKKIKQEYR